MKREAGVEKIDVAGGNWEVVYGGDLLGCGGSEDS